MNAKARRRAEVIFQVRSGQSTATAAAQALGISRQQYYQWEQRALTALLSALEDQPTGRPKTPTDPEKELLQRRVQQLEQQVRQQEQKEHLRQLLNQWAAKDKLPPAKKKPK
jgi:transposase